MRCLVVSKIASPEEPTPEWSAHLFASLDANSIQWGRADIGALPSASAINTGFDFIVIPRMASGYDAIVNDATVTIPMFGLFAQAGAAGYGSDPGVTGGRSALGDRFVDVPFTNEAFVAVQAGSYELAAGAAAGKPLVTVSATIPNINAVWDGTAQSEAGEVFAWRTNTAGGNYLYVSALHAANHCYLPFLLQEAINDYAESGGTKGLDKTSTKGNRSLRRAPMSVDLDHINGEWTHTDSTILNKIASYVPKGGVIWCGIFNANADYFQNMSSAVNAQLKKYSGGPFLYCWHTHVDLYTSGTYPNVTELVNKTAQETDYVDDEAVWNGLGLEFHYPAYFNSGSNMWSNSTMELYSEDTSIISDGAETNTQAGFGFRVFRTTRASERAQPERGNLHFNQHAYKHTAHGIQMLNTYDMAYGNLQGGDVQDMPYDVIANWRNNFQYLCQAISMGQVMYLHDEDFLQADQDPGVKQHGYVQMQIIADTGNYLKDVVHSFANPVDYVPKTAMDLS